MSETTTPASAEAERPRDPERLRKLDQLESYVRMPFEAVLAESVRVEKELRSLQEQASAIQAVVETRVGGVSVERMLEDLAHMREQSDEEFQAEHDRAINRERSRQALELLSSVLKRGGRR